MLPDFVPVDRDLIDFHLAQRLGIGGVGEGNRQPGPLLDLALDVGTIVRVAGHSRRVGGQVGGNLGMQIEVEVQAHEQGEGVMLGQ